MNIVQIVVTIARIQSAFVTEIKALKTEKLGVKILVDTAFFAKMMRNLLKYWTQDWVLINQFWMDFMVRLIIDSSIISKLIVQGGNITELDFTMGPKTNVYHSLLATLVLATKLRFRHSMSVTTRLPWKSRVKFIWMLFVSGISCCRFEYLYRKINYE